jgi:hypothetical protein
MGILAALDPYLTAIKLGATAFACVALFGSGWHVRGRLDDAEANKVALVTLQAKEKLINDNDALVEKERAEFEANNRKVAYDNQHALDGVRAELDKMRASVRLAGGLRVSAAICDGVKTTGETPGTGGSDARAAATVALPERITEKLLADAALADEVLETARSCQAFILSNGLVPAMPDIVATEK